MLIEHLSDHTGDLLRRTARQSQVAGDDEATWEIWRQMAARDLAAARRARPLWRRVVGVPSPDERAAQERAEKADRRVLEATARGEELAASAAKQSAGARGEDALTGALAPLPDDWLLFRGYRNRRGETDHLLVGPDGLWAVEVKNQNVRLHVDGPQWWYEKLDRWGNIVGTAQATDRSGRTWARQVNDVADALEHRLRQAQLPVLIKRAVVIVHDRAELGRCRDPGVDLVSTRSHELVKAIADNPSPVAASTRSAVAEVIRRDHLPDDRRRRRRA